MIINSNHVEKTHIDENLFHAAYHTFERYPDLSSADTDSVALMKDGGIQQIISFDRVFGAVRDVVRLETTWVK